MSTSSGQTKRGLAGRGRPHGVTLRGATSTQNSSSTVASEAFTGAVTGSLSREAVRSKIKPEHEPAATDARNASVAVAGPALPDTFLCDTGLDESGDLPSFISDDDADAGPLVAERLHDKVFDYVAERYSLPPHVKTTIEAFKSWTPLEEVLPKHAPLQLRICSTFTRAAACIPNPASYDTVELQHVLRRNIKRLVGEDVIAALRNLQKKIPREARGANLEDLVAFFTLRLANAMCLVEQRYPEDQLKAFFRAIADALAQEDRAGPLHCALLVNREANIWLLYLLRRASVVEGSGKGTSAKASKQSKRSSDEAGTKMEEQDFALQMTKQAPRVEQKRSRVEATPKVKLTKETKKLKLAADAPGQGNIAQYFAGRNHGTAGVKKETDDEKMDVEIVDLTMSDVDC